MMNYKELLKTLIPIGPAWPREEGTNLDKTLQAYSDELARVDLKVQELLRESDPRTAVTTLPEWERMYGLPDECSTPNQTLQERRNALVSKVSSQGGQSAQYFIDVAKALGYTITIDEPIPFRFGISRFSDPLYDEDWIHWFIVNGAEFEIRYFRFGASSFGEPFAFWGNSQLECVLNKLKPAHVQIVFSYE